MSSTVFVVSPDNKLTALKRSPYDSEDLFQTLLADHPALLGEIAGDDGRLLLVKREAPVPEAQDGAGRWSLDHLFLDRNGVPVLVEVKRATDTRIRREVVAQMLDYAANGVAYWPIGQIVDAANTTAQQAGEDGDARLAAFLDGGDVEAFWRQVEANLKSGRIRMVFVADAIPKELRRIVEFLNEQMRPAEVLAIEVEQYATDQGLRLLTPRVVGATERAATAKSVQSVRTPASEEEWLEQLESTKGREVRELAERLIELLRRKGFRVGGTRALIGLSAGIDGADGRTSYPFFVGPEGVWADLYHLQFSASTYAEEAPRIELLNALKSLPGVQIKTTKSTGYPAVSYSDLTRPMVWQGFEAILDMVLARLGAGS